MDANIDLRTMPENDRQEALLARIKHFESCGFDRDIIDSIRSSFLETLVRPDYLDEKIGHLKECGFLNPVKLIATYPVIISLSIENIDVKIADLKDYGFSDTVKIITRFPAILGISIDKIKARIDELKERGFRDSVKMVSILPSVLGMTVDNIDRKIEYLRELGFANPIKMITRCPAILSYAIDSIDKKISDLKERGFTNPIKMITTNPNFLGLSIDSIDKKISDLKERGFTNPIKMIITFPGILKLSIDNIDRKIEDLRERGFTKPIELITRNSVILGYSIKNIDRKICLIEKVSARFDFEETAPEILERELCIFGCKIDKLLILTRVLCENNHTPTPRDIKALLYAKLEHVVLAHIENNDGSFERLICGIKAHRQSGLSREDSRVKIRANIEANPSSKVLLRYIRGYPLTAAAEE